MNVLIIGGSVFVGRHITNALLEAGHSVTHFNRGVTETTPRNDVEIVTGDRMHRLDRLAGRTWDAVVDTCAYVPAAVDLAAKALRDRTNRYVFISTLSVYDYENVDDGRPITETSRRAELPAEADVSTMTPETYGALKALCEDVIDDAFGERATIVRCGLMVGPYDRTDRFTYWVVRAARGGGMIAPVSPDEPMQFIDVRDVADFVVRSVERSSAGTYNVTGLPGRVTFGSLLEGIVALTGANAEFVWLDRDAIARSGLEAWKEIPLWLDDARFMRNLHNASVDRALAAGLRFRPLDETITDTLAWARSRPADHRMAHGMTPERETEALCRTSS